MLPRLPSYPRATPRYHGDRTPPGRLPPLEAFKRPDHLVELLAGALNSHQDLLYYRLILLSILKEPNG
jgi:hypothetical protein